MKVRELIKKLEIENQEAIVIMSSDAEGNNYSPLSGVADGAYEPENDYRGEVGCLELTDELIDEGYDGEDILENGEIAVILYPTN